jgi:hypothetical protein
MVKTRRGSDSVPKKKDTKMRTDTQGSSAEVGGMRIDPQIQTEIGRHLRAIYDDVINEPVPTKFLELLEKLERSATTRKS